MKKIILLLLSFVCLLALSFPASAQIIKTIAGNGITGYVGDTASAVTAELNSPWGVCLDTAHNVYIADYENSVVRKVNASGTIITVAGATTSIATYSGDGGPAISAGLYNPQDVAIAPDGSLYILDAGNNVIRKVNASGVISTIAGNGISGFSGDGGAAISAELNQPAGIAVDKSGNIYVADYNNFRIRKVNTAGIITTIAGNGFGASVGTGGYSGDGGPATEAELFYPTGVAVDKTGNVFIADYENNAVRKVDTAGIITTVAGTGINGFSGDMGLAVAAELSTPSHVAVDTVGNLYIADLGNNRIRKVNTLGIINTIAGTGSSGFSGDNGRAVLSALYNPQGISVDGTGSIYIADESNARIRYISSSGYFPSLTGGASQTLAVCENSSYNSLDALLAINDSDICQTETWSVSSAPAHGTLTGFPAALTVNGGSITPAGLSYFPAAGYSGTDVFTIKVSDGRISATTTIHVTVNPLPVAGVITSVSSMCVSDTTNLTESVNDGLWSSSGNAIAVTGAGKAIALVPGADTIFYSTSNDCGEAVATKTITVMGLVAPGTITVADSLCIGDAVRLTAASFSTVIDTGGTWSVSNSSALYSIADGMLTAVRADTFTLYYSLTNGCDTFHTSEHIRIDSFPHVAEITGLSALCEGYLIMLTDTGTDSGIWSSNNANATVDNGLVEGITGGIDTINYEVVNACGSVTAQKRIVIDSLPVAGTVTGPSAVCVGAAIDLSDGTHGGVWSPSNSFASVTGSGQVFGLAAGIDTMTYIVTNYCGTASAEKVITVEAFSAGVIAGSDTVCQSGTDTLSDSLSGGRWSSMYNSIATVSNDGIVSGLEPGADTIIYTITNSCGTTDVKLKIQVISAEACGMPNSVPQVAGVTITDLKVYPNPNDGTFTFQLNSDKDEPVQVIITNTAGARIKEFVTTTNKPAEVSFNQPSGIYFMTATTATGRYVAKLFVN